MERAQSLPQPQPQGRVAPGQLSPHLRLKGCEGPVMLTVSQVLSVGVKEKGISD